MSQRQDSQKESCLPLACTVCKIKIVKECRNIRSRNEETLRTQQLYLETNLMANSDNSDDNLAQAMFI